MLYRNYNNVVDI